MRFYLRSLFVAALLPLSLPAAIETWITPSGMSMQAECLGRKGDYVIFKKTDGTRVLFPFVKLSGAEQARIEGLEFKTTNNTVAVASTEVVDETQPSKIAKALSGKLVGLNGRALGQVPGDRLAGTRMYAVYFSASWCGPCRRFTPELVEAYPKIKAAHPEFEVIFVSADRDEESMRHYMIDDHMMWLALRFKDVRSNSTLLRYERNGIPNLVFIDGDGRILSKSYDDQGNYVGPQKVLSDIQKHFRM